MPGLKELVQGMQLVFDSISTESLQAKELQVAKREGPSAAQLGKGPSETFL
jgi:hypothetical protein